MWAPIFDFFFLLPGLPVRPSQRFPHIRMQLRHIPDLDQLTILVAPWQSTGFRAVLWYPEYNFGSLSRSYGSLRGNWQYNSVCIHNLKVGPAVASPVHRRRPGSRWDDLHFPLNATKHWFIKCVCRYASASCSLLRSKMSGKTYWQICKTS